MNRVDTCVRCDRRRDASRTCQAALGELDEALDVVGEDEWSDAELSYLRGERELPV